MEPQSVQRTGIIYLVTSPSGRRYVGQTFSGLRRRRTAHESNARNIKSIVYNTKFSRAIRKYGNQLLWEVIHENIQQDKIDDLETQEIVNYNTFDAGYNSVPSAFGGGFIGKKHKPSTRAILSDGKKGSKNPMYGKTGTLNPFFWQKPRRKIKKNLEKTRPVWQQ